jgi:hypothetical protein
MQKMMLVEFLQKHSTTMPLGDKPGARLRTGNDAAAYDDLRRVQQTNDFYFKIYWALLVVICVATIVIALIYRSELGGLTAVLGTGGIVQGGLILKLSGAWKDKARIDIVAVLSRRLAPEQLQVVLKELLEQLRK